MTEDLIPLQNILFKPSIEASKKLLFSQASDNIVEKGSLLFKEGETAEFASYFNLFSWNRWNQLTGINRLYLILDMKGAFSLCFRSYDDGGKCIGEYETEAREEGRAVLPLPEHILKGHIVLSLKARGDSELLSGSWATKEAPCQRDIRIAAVFCTFNRDEFLFPNLEALSKADLKYSDVFIVDNASRIPGRKIEALGENFHLFHNPNTGGSGGFTRGLMEALESDKAYTHVLFMDDDIRLEAESIIRSENLISLLKSEYHHHFLDGAMMHLDKPEVMYEQASGWNGYAALRKNKNRDLLNFENLCRINKDISGSNLYSGWWYCCFPLNEKIRTNLPYPFFVKGDDLDFSLSHAPGFLTLNGIGIWHESFENKEYPFFAAYLYCRNTLILNTLHPDRYSGFISFFNCLLQLTKHLLVHDYLSAAYVLDGMEDYLKGADYCLGLDEIKLLKEKNIKALNQDKKLLKNKRYKVVNTISGKKRIGYFLNKRLALPSENESFEIRERSFRTIFTLKLRFIKLSLRFFKEYKRNIMSYGNIERNMDFWKKRFSIYKNNLTREIR